MDTDGAAEEDVTGLYFQGVSTDVQGSTGKFVKGGKFHSTGKQDAADQDIYGIEVDAVNGTNMYAIHAEADDGGGNGTTYGIYTDAAGGATNWAAYFASGNT